MRFLALGLSAVLLAGCQSSGYAPIREGTRQKPAPIARQPAQPVVVATEARQDGQHLVQKGDTLFGIAFQNGLDYRDLAFWNNLASPDVIKVGQLLRLTPPEDSAGRAPGVETIPLRETSLPKPKTIQPPTLLTEPKAQRLPYSEANWALLTTAKPGVVADVARSPQTSQAAPQPGQTVAQPPATNASPSVQKGEQDDWRWPAGGVLLGTFSQAGGKGIDIAGERQTPVLAAAPGKVVYSGNGLRGYGKLLIVKHSGEFLTAYAHNQNLLVKEGDWVRGGQKIAEMGDTDSDRVKLHFEIRQYGKPLDPLNYLPERK